MGKSKRGEDGEGAAAGGDFSIHKLRQVCQILELLKADKTQKEAGEALGLEDSTVSNILSRLGTHLEITLQAEHPKLKGQLIDQAEEFLSAAQRLVKDYEALLHPRAFGSSRVLIGTFSAMIQLFLRHVFRNLAGIDRSPHLKGEGIFVERFPRTAIHALQYNEAVTLLHDIARGVTDCGIMDFQQTSPLLSHPGISFLPLFPNRRKGFLYHRENTVFSEAIAPGSKQDLRDVLEEQTLICATPEMRLLEYGRALPPKERMATRFFVENYFQVYVSVFEGIGVGVGFPEEVFNLRDVVRFIAFDDLPKEALDGSVLQTLRNAERSTYYLCVSSKWDRPRARKGLTDAAKAVVRSILDTGKAVKTAWAA